MASSPQRESDASDIKRSWPSIIPKWVGVGLFLYLSVFALGYAESFFVPLVLAFLLSMVFGPVRRFMDRRGIPQALSAFAIVMALLVALLLVAAALAAPVTGWVQNAPRIELQVEYQLSQISGPFSDIFASKQSSNADKSKSSPIQKVENQSVGMATHAAALAPGMLAQFVFTLVLLLFLLASGDMFYEKIVHVMPTLSDKRRATLIAHNIERKLSRYLLTITIINAGLGCAVGIAMWLLGMPSPVVFGVIAFTFNFVPYLGALGGIVIAAAVALISYHWLGWPLIIAGIYFALTTIEGQFVTPYCVGRRLRLNTVVVFVAVSFWAWLWSAVGMIVAVPLLVSIKTFCEHIDGLEPLGDFLSERHAEMEDEPEPRREAG